MTLPVSILTPPPVDFTGVVKELSQNYKGKVSAVCRSKQECADLVHTFRGFDFYPAYGPVLPILLAIPGAPQQVAGWGLATIEEMRDQCVAVWEITEERLTRYNGQTVDFDVLREKHGQMRREDAGIAIQEAVHERIKAHKASPRTDPPREPHYVRPNEKTVFAQPQETTWKDNPDA